MTATRRQKPGAIRIKRSCSRCFRRLTGAQLREGMTVLEDGRAGATVCNQCLSAEEVGHLAWLEATSEAALNLYDNRVVIRDRFRSPTGAGAN
jgi:hypothetical protein